MNQDEIEKLAKLSRIELTAEEKTKLASEFGAILDYVGQIKEASNGKSGERDQGLVRNVMREDNPPAGGPHEPGLFTEDILSQAPAREGNYLKVKKIL